MSLERLIAGLERLGKTGATEINDGAAEALQGVLDLQYESGRGPSGEAWANKADGTPSHLTKSGQMRGATKAIRGVRGVDVKVPKPGGFHQSGTAKMDARKIVPDDGAPLPPEWDAAVADSSRRVITRALEP